MFRSHKQEQGVLLEQGLLEERRTRTWPMQVTLGEEGSCWDSITVVFFLRMNIGLDRDLPLLLLPGLVLRNFIINGGGYFSVLLGLDMGFVEIIISLYLYMCVCLCVETVSVSVSLLFYLSGRSGLVWSGRVT